MFTTGMSLFLTSFLYSLSLHLTFYSFTILSLQTNPKFCLPAFSLDPQLPPASSAQNFMVKDKRTCYCSPIPQNRLLLLTSLFLCTAPILLHRGWSQSLITPCLLHSHVRSLAGRIGSFFTVSDVSFPLSFPFHSHYDLHPSGLSFFLELLYCLELRGGRIHFCSSSEHLRAILHVILISSCQQPSNQGISILH